MDGDEIVLKPCPFCGEEAQMMGDLYPYVECSGCGVNMSHDHKYDSNFEAAAEDWNIRVTKPNPKPATETPVVLECREIGEGDWESCTVEWFQYCNNSALHDTRVREITAADVPKNIIHELTQEVREDVYMSGLILARSKLRFARSLVAYCMSGNEAFETLYAEQLKYDDEVDEKIKSIMEKRNGS